MYYRCEFNTVYWQYFRETGKQASWWLYGREKDMAVFCRWLTDASAVTGEPLRKSWAHRACKYVWFCCGLGFCCCSLFWNSSTSLCSALLNYEVLWPSDTMLGWDDRTMKLDIFRAFQPQSKILDNIDNINIWGRNFQQKITRPKPFSEETDINKRFSISVWRENMFS